MRSISSMIMFISRIAAAHDEAMEARVFTIQRYMGQMQEVSPETEE